MITTTTEKELEARKIQITEYNHNLSTIEFTLPPEPGFFDTDVVPFDWENEEDDLYYCIEIKAAGYEDAVVVKLNLLT